MLTCQVSAYKHLTGEHIKSLTPRVVCLKSSVRIHSDMTVQLFCILLLRHGLLKLQETGGSTGELLYVQVFVCASLTELSSVYLSPASCNAWTAPPAGQSVTLQS